MLDLKCYAWKIGVVSDRIHGQPQIILRLLYKTYIKDRTRSCAICCFYSRITYK